MTLLLELISCQYRAVSFTFHFFILNFTRPLHVENLEIIMKLKMTCILAPYTKIRNQYSSQLGRLLWLHLPLLVNHCSGLTVMFWDAERRSDSGQDFVFSAYAIIYCTQVISYTLVWFHVVPYPGVLTAAARISSSCFGWCASLHWRSIPESP